MPQKAMKTCRHPGCVNLVKDGRYCQEHSIDLYVYDQMRGNANERGYNVRWRRARTMFLSKHPLCSQCGKPATVVDHIIPHRGNQQLFWDEANWQPLCKTCHDKKTRSGL
ncbi:MAG: HNH endonuclease [Succinivibrionaceae bacterium]|nr:HNH endonuclease [Succinivibrionaceae bacterium]